MAQPKFHFFLVTLFLLCAIAAKAQNVYKTPSGHKYHLASCQMVENVSAKLVGEADINAHGLTPCKICKPPAIKDIQKNYTSTNKAVGEAASVQCNGKTKSGSRCQHKTKLANGYCYQHTEQNSSSGTAATSAKKTTSSTSKSSTASSEYCGAKNKSGGYCKRKVNGGGRCYQHN
jgi:Family of unknown function (DUF5763)